MKFGVRTPNLKRSFKARTTGRMKRRLKSAIPGYGRRGMGWIKDPNRAAYNYIYNRTTVSAFGSSSSEGRQGEQAYSQMEYLSECASIFRHMKKERLYLRIAGWIIFLTSGAYRNDILLAISIIIGSALLFVTSRRVEHKNNKALSSMKYGKANKGKEILSNIIDANIANKRTMELMVYNLYYFENNKQGATVFARKATELGSTDPLIREINGSR